MMEWCPFAARLDGPAWKQGYTGISRRVGKGSVVHSMEGRLQAALGRLESSDLASWTFSLGYGGQLFQHYPLSTCCWHAGDYFANTHFWGCETEGRVGEPLTAAQKDTLVRLLLWSAEEEDWPGFVLQKNTGTLHEHNWYAATACPSGRIPWAEIIGRCNAVEERVKTLEGQVAYLIEVAKILDRRLREAGKALNPPK